MLIYFLLFGYFAVGAIVNGLREVAPRRAHLGIAAFILIILIGFRWHIGADWSTYRILLAFSRLGSMALNVRSEPAYALLNSIAAAQGWDIWFPNLICAIIFTYGLMVFAQQQPNPWLALVVALPYLIIGVGMGFTRQSAAVGLTMVAFVQLTQGKHVRMFFSVLVAAMFHASAIIIAPVLALANVKRAIVTAITLIVFAVALYFSFSERIAERMNEYTTYKYVAGGAIPRIIMNIVPATIFLLYRRRFSNRPDELRLWTLLSLLAFLTLPLMLFVSSSTIVDRVGIFIVPLQLFVLSRAPLVFGGTRQQNFGFLLVVIGYSLAVQAIWFSFGTEANSWIPYRNYLWETVFAPENG